MKAYEALRKRERVTFEGLRLREKIASCLAMTCDNDVCGYLEKLIMT